jgi:hypothetical protein
MAAPAARPARDSILAFRRYLAIAVLGILFLVSPIGPGLLILWQADELTGIDAVAAAQSDEDVLYGTGVHANDVEHRLALIDRRKPDVVALGSSRMEQFRQPFFEAPFVCLCTVMGAIEDARPLILEMLKRHKPKTVIFGLDYWWFTTLPQGRNVHAVRADANAPTLQKIMAPLLWLADGRMAAGDAIDILRDGHPVTTLPGFRLMGLAARVQGRGTRFDGSALHGELLFTDGPSKPSQDIALTLERIRDGHPLYPHAVGIDPARIALLEEAEALLRDNGVAVVTILPPMLGAAVDAMAARPDFAYLDEIRGALQRLDFPVHDFHDARPAGSSDCEFIDDRHAGDVANMRLLFRIGQAVDTGALPWSQDRLRSDIERFSGHAIAMYAPEKYRGIEGDFLRLGCPKEPLS